MKVTSLYHYTVLVYIVSGNQPKWILCISDLISGKLRSIQISFTLTNMIYPIQPPKEWLFFFETLYCVCNNDKFNSMYGWYGCNFLNRWKIVHFGWFLNFFGTFGVHIRPHILSSRPINDYYIFETLHCVCNYDKFDSMRAWYGCYFQNSWKIVHFR